MCNYVITNSMKRHERSNLCVKLFREIYDSRKILHLVAPLWKVIDSKLKAQNKFRPSKEPVFAISAFTHKGIPFYLISYQNKNIEMFFNTSPIDAAYVEFTRVIATDSTSAMVITQHALDRYNERIHGKKYTNYKDMMKRLIVNNPMSNSQVVDRDNKIVMKVNEGFLSGSADPVHKILTINTFFDKVEFEDNKLQHKARLGFDTLRSLTPSQQAMMIVWKEQYRTGQITLEQLIDQLILHGFPTDDKIKEINTKSEKRSA